MKKLFACFVVAACVCAFALPNLYAVDAPADGIKMDKTSMPVTFNHSTHTKEDCRFCHHKASEDMTDIKSCSAEGCHDVLDRKDKSEKSYYKAMHGNHKTIPTCVSCHREEAKANGDKEFKKMMTSCKGSACHPK